MTSLPPNTALEPIADPRFGLAGSAGFAMRQFGGGPAFTTVGYKIHPQV